MSQSEHPYVSVDVRRHCPVLIQACGSKSALPGPEEQYIIKLFLKEVTQRGTVCPRGGCRDITSNDGFPMLELADFSVRVTRSGHIRATLDCVGCRHLPDGFKTKELTLKPRTLTGR